MFFLDSGLKIFGWCFQNFNVSRVTAWGKTLGTKFEWLSFPDCILWVKRNILGRKVENKLYFFDWRIIGRLVKTVVCVSIRIFAVERYFQKCLHGIGKRAEKSPHIQLMILVSWYTLHRKIINQRVSLSPGRMETIFLATKTIFKTKQLKRPNTMNVYVKLKTLASPHLSFSTNGATGEEATYFQSFGWKIERKDKIFTRRGNHVHSKTDLFYHYSYSTYCFERKKKKCIENHANKWMWDQHYGQHPLK